MFATHMKINIRLDFELYFPPSVLDILMMSSWSIEWTFFLALEYLKLAIAGKTSCEGFRSHCEKVLTHELMMRVP